MILDNIVQVINNPLTLLVLISVIVALSVNLHRLSAFSRK